MPVNVISTIKPKNQGTFPVAEAVDIKVTDDLRLDAALNEKASQSDMTAVQTAVASKASQSDLTALSETVSGKANKSDIPYVTPQNFGAVGDGDTDDTQAFEDAITYCHENKRRLFVPRGSYKITNTLTLPQGFIMFGETILFANVSSKIYLDSDEDIPLFSLGNGDNELNNIRITDIYLVNKGYSGTPENNTKNIGIEFKYTTEMLFENLYIIGFNIAIKATNMTITTFRGLTTYYCNTVFDWTGSSTTYIENSNIYESHLVFNNIGNISVQKTHIESFKNFINKNNSTYLLNVSFDCCNLVSTKNTTFLVSSKTIDNLIFSNCAIRCNSIDYLFDCGASANIRLRYTYVFGINCYIRSSGAAVGRLEIEGYKIDSKNYDGSGSDKPSNVSGTAIVVYNYNDGVYETNGGISLSFPRASGKAQLCIDTTTGFPAWLTSGGKYYGMQFGRAGHSSDRPTDKPNGFIYFDLDLHKPLWRYGTEWVDANGDHVAYDSEQE